MSLSELVSSYINSAEHVLSEITIMKNLMDFSHSDVQQVIELAKAYLQDAKYYREKGQFEVSLASVAYCEGLLDALKMLRVVKFEWTKRKENVK